MTEVAGRADGRAAALFISEGLKLHTRELSELDESLTNLEQATELLKQRAREVFRPDKESQAGGSEETTLAS